jgi:FkbH-like protein
MRARLGAIDDISFARALQLANKTNQFNLTTRRFTESELRALIGRPETLTLTVRLADRFGDHGLVGVLTASVDGDALQVEDWLMSCRVLKRGVEHMLVGELAACARERGLTRLRARFVATGRNELVRSLLDELGFTRERESQAEVAYSLDLGGFEAPRHFISVVRGGER